MDTTVPMAVSTGIQETETATAVSTAAIMAATTIREKGRDVYHIEDNYMDKIIHKICFKDRHFCVGNSIESCVYWLLND